jgi:hypothetical protein
MQKVSVELSAKQAEQLLDQLSVQVKIRLVRRWEQQTWPERFRQLLQQMDHRIQQDPRLVREALQVVGPARRAFYASRRRH